MRLKEFVLKNQSVNEGWRELAALGTALGITGGAAGYHYSHLPKKDTSAQTQPQRQYQVIPSIDSLKQAKQAITSPLGKVLHRAARAAGMRGDELSQFLAQCAHETQNFTHMSEQGDQEYFKQYDQRLGNHHKGDGARYKGRGFIQLTGRDNYRRAGKALGLPLEDRPELAEQPRNATAIALWYWQNRVRPQVDNFSNTMQVTKPINPAALGIRNRDDLYQAIDHLLGHNQKQVKNNT